MHWKLLQLPYALACANYFLLFLIPEWTGSTVYLGVNDALIFFVDYQAVRRYDVQLWTAALYGTTVIGVVFFLGVIVISFFDWTTHLSMKVQGIIGYFLSLLAFVPVAILLAAIGGIVGKATRNAHKA